MKKVRGYLSTQCGSRLGGRGGFRGIAGYASNPATHQMRTGRAIAPMARQSALLRSLDRVRKLPRPGAIARRSQSQRIANGQGSGHFDRQSGATPNLAGGQHLHELPPGRRHPDLAAWERLS